MPLRSSSHHASLYFADSDTVHYAGVEHDVPEGRVFPAVLLRGLSPPERETAPEVPVLRGLHKKGRELNKIHRGHEKRILPVPQILGHRLYARSDNGHARSECLQDDEPPPF